jgi:TRAP-type uncharacterized transport system fused permease subunit
LQRAEAFMVGAATDDVARIHGHDCSGKFDQFGHPVLHVVGIVVVAKPLFDGPIVLIALSVVTATAGTLAIGIAMAGYFMRPVGWIKRGLLAAAGIGLLIPPGGDISFSWTANVAGAVVLALILTFEWRARRQFAVAT